MESATLQKLLMDSGLDDKEARLYVAGIELGEATIQELAEQGGIKRPTAYEIMKQLERRGLFSEVKMGTRRKFLAEKPESVLAIIKTREKAFHEALPELHKLHSAGSKKPRTKFYDGVEGLKAIYWGTLEAEGPILGYGSVDSMLDVMPREFMRDYVKERVRRNVFYKGLSLNTSAAQEYVHRDKEEMRELILISADRFPFSNEVNIYNDKVAIISFPERIGIVIESKKIAETQRALFELAWLGAPRRD